ncbi:Uncharacterised protein [uncultured archaeon]|nr:Uncharacterised protein [uncultured archaeon]
MANANDEVKQCYICKTKKGNLSFDHTEFSRDKDTGKGSSVPRYICDADKGDINRAIRRVVARAENWPKATRLSMVEGLK